MLDKLVFVLAVLVGISACSAGEQGGNESTAETAQTAETNLIADGWLQILVPEGWEPADSTGVDTWSVEGWTSAWSASTANESADRLLINGEYGPDGAALAASRLVSDTYFGAFPGFVTEGARWIEPENGDEPRIRRVDFVYGTAETDSGVGVIWAVEDADYRTAVAAVKGVNLSESLIADIENSLDFIGE